MQVIMIGNLSDRDDVLDNLPDRGIVIEATKEELMNLPNLLYKDVEIKPKGEAND